MELAVHATQACNFSDWWWKLALGRCYLTLGLLRDAEQQLQSASRQQRRSDTPLRVSRVLCRLDQPTAALQVCRAAEKSFPGDVGLLTEQVIYIYRILATLLAEASNIQRKMCAIHI